MYNNNSFIRLLVAGFVIIVIVFICNELWQTTVTGQEYYLEDDNLTYSDLISDLFESTRGHEDCFGVTVIYRGLINFSLNQNDSNFRIAHYYNYKEYYKDGKEWVLLACGIENDLEIASN